MKADYQNLAEALDAAAKTEHGITFLDQKEPVMLTYRQIRDEACRVAVGLQQRGVAAGDRVVIVLPTSPDFATSWWGVVLAGGVPTVLPSPRLSRAVEQGIDKIRSVVSKIDAKLVITTEMEAEDWGRNFDHCSIIDVATLAMGVAADYRPVPRQPDDLALIQATSGSTSEPKCVALTHAHVLIHCEQLGERYETVPDDIVVSWLPMFHDMGLIGCMLYVLYWRLQSVLLPPSKFIRRPYLWVKAISDYRGTGSPAPNFAYGLLLKKITDEQLSTLDLSSWRHVVCGSEPIDPILLRRFADRYNQAKLNPRAITPSYGMAEVSLCVTVPSPHELLRYETISDGMLHSDGIAVPPDPNGRSIDVCNCGRPLAGTSIAIRNAHCESLPEGHVGRIWISGPSIMQGYLGDPVKTAETLVDGWLDSGDIGYMRDGHLFVLGREKELIIIRGHNYYPTDFERAAEEIDGVEAGRVVAFGRYDPAIYSEALHLVCEVRKSQQRAELAEQIKAHVASRTGIPPAAVHLVSRGTIPRTTSGKLQRRALRERFAVAHDR